MNSELFNAKTQDEKTAELTRILNANVGNELVKEVLLGDAAPLDIKVIWTNSAHTAKNAKIVSVTFVKHICRGKNKTISLYFGKNGVLEGSSTQWGHFTETTRKYESEQIRNAESNCTSSYTPTMYKYEDVKDDTIAYSKEIRVSIHCLITDDMKVSKRTEYYNAAGQLHCKNGPAIVTDYFPHRPMRKLYYVNGEEVTREKVAA